MRHHFDCFSSPLRWCQKNLRILRINRGKPQFNQNRPRQAAIIPQLYNDNLLQPPTTQIRIPSQNRIQFPYSAAQMRWNTREKPRNYEKTS